jgi:hypothetical protein
MMNFSNNDAPLPPIRSTNGRPRTIHVTLDLYHRLSIALIADPQYAKDEVVRLLRDDELLVDTLGKNISHKATGEVVGTFHVIEEDSEIEYVDLDEAPPS